MAELLTPFLRRSARREWAWGRHDCLMWLADWIKTARGFDPAAEWRGRYGTQLGAARLLKKRGGMAAHLDLCLAPYGIGRTAAPVRGDIALVEGPEGLLGGIVLGRGRVAIAAQGGGFVASPAHIVVAWAV